MAQIRTPASKGGEPSVSRRVPASAIWILCVVVAGLAIAVSTWSVAGGVALGVLLFGAGVSWFDITSLRIPDPLTTGVLVTGVGIAIVGDRLGYALGSAVLVGAAMLVVHLTCPEGLGFGDVKYTGALAGLLGTLVSVASTAGVVTVAAVVAAGAALTVPRWREGVPFGAVVSVCALVAVLAGGR